MHICCYLGDVCFWVEIPSACYVFNTDTEFLLFSNSRIYWFINVISINLHYWYKMACILTWLLLNEYWLIDWWSINRTVAWNSITYLCQWSDGFLFTINYTQVTACQCDMKHIDLHISTQHVMSCHRITHNTQPPPWLSHACFSYPHLRTPDRPTWARVVQY